jgi:serpin B
VSSLKATGLEDMSDQDKADFSGMTGSKDCFVGAVVQKASIEVNEVGSEAAAATSTGIELNIFVPPKTPFHCDRPFLFVIKDDLSGMVLFTGRVVDPTK